MTPITLDEFFEMAQLGGQIKACYDIFLILNDDDLGPEEITKSLQKYQQDTFVKFQKAQLRFKSGGSKVRMDEESVEGLGDD